MQHFEVMLMGIVAYDPNQQCFSSICLVHFDNFHSKQKQHSPSALFQNSSIVSQPSLWASAVFLLEAVPVNAGVQFSHDEGIRLRCACDCDQVQRITAVS